MEKLIELDRTEALNINGGGEAWNFLGRAWGVISDFLEDVCDAWANTPEGQAAQQALIDFQ